MTTEKLIIELDAKTGRLQKELNDTTKRLDWLEKTSKKSDKALLSMSKAGDKAADTFLGFTGAITGITAALTAFVAISSSSDKEMANLSRTAKTSKENFEALAFAMSQAGVDAKGTADAMNDVTERIGEFAAAGSGAFQDYADVMGLNAQQARALAKEMQNLSGEDAVLKLTQNMEKANVPAAQMSFVMKSLSNDLEYASGLFAGQGKELKRLKGRYSDLNKEINLSSGESKNLRDMSESFDLLTTSLGKASKEVSSKLAPDFEAFFNGVIETVPRATDAVVRFINSFKSAGDIEEIQEVRDQLFFVNKELTEQVMRKKDLEGSFIAPLFDFDKTDENIKRLQEESKALTDQLTLLTKQADELPSTGDGKKGSFTKKEGNGTGGVADSDLEAIANRFKSEEKLLTQKYEKELEIAAGNKEALMELDVTEEERKQEEFNKEIAAHQDMLSKKLISEESYLKKVNKTAVKYGKLDEKQVKTLNKDKDKSNIEYTNDAINLSNQLFGSNKAVSSVTAVINTAEGVTKALASQDYAGAAFTAVAGAAQILSINSASVGGGSSSVASAPSSAPTASAQPSVTGEVEINESIGSGGQTSSASNTVTITAEDGDELAEAFASVMNKKLNSGEITLG
jgi:hypothetical protein